MQECVEKLVQGFRKRLESARRSAGTGIVWYPYDSLSNLLHIQRLLDGKTGILDDVRGKRILDIGCSDGDVSFLLESCGAIVTAMDNPRTQHNGMRGIYRLKEALSSSVSILETDLDMGLELPKEDFELVLALGLLYHLKNPFGFLEALARRCTHCILSTRIARYLPSTGRAMEDVPLAYLVGDDEVNADNSNYWIFSETCLRQLFRRTHWRLLTLIRVGDTVRSDPISSLHDERAFCLLVSQWGRADIQRVSGWHGAEQDGWRWTEKVFEVVVPCSEEGVQVALKIHLHPAVLGVARDGRLTLRCTADGVELPGESYTEAGDYWYVRKAQRRDDSGSVKLRFELSDALPADESDNRERGVIVAALTYE